MKTIGIVQPYIFPYLPYFQLIHAVDEFWFLDDVQYIRRGWMNRNFLFEKGQRKPFSLPVSKGHRDDLIQNKILAEEFSPALSDLHKQINHCYGKAPGFPLIDTLMESLASQKWKYFIDFALASQQRLWNILSIQKPVKLTSELAIDGDFRGVQRILEICRLVGAEVYVNPIGGVALYKEKDFEEKGVQLRFLKGEFKTYSQNSTAPFEPGLSIIDLIAWVNPNNYSEYLEHYRLIRQP